MGKHLLLNKRLENLKKYFKRVKECISRLQPKELNQKKLIQCATNNLNSIASHKYVVLPNFVEENTQQDENFHKIYDFYRLVKVQKYAKRYKRNDIRKTIKNVKNQESHLSLVKKILYLLKD